MADERGRSLYHKVGNFHGDAGGFRLPGASAFCKKRDDEQGGKDTAFFLLPEPGASQEPAGVGTDLCAGASGI